MSTFSLKEACGTLCSAHGSRRSCLRINVWVSQKQLGFFKLNASYEPRVTDVSDSHDTTQHTLALFREELREMKCSIQGHRSVGKKRLEDSSVGPSPKACALSADLYLE